MKKRTIFVNILLIVLLIVTIAWALTSGASKTKLTDLSNQDLNIILNIRLPRICSALIAGAALSVAGLFFQAAFRNPIAEPGLMGVSAAAGLFQTLFALVFPTFFIGKSLFATFGAIVAFLILIQFQKMLDPFRLIIVGVALNAVFTGISQILGANNSSSLATSTWTSALILCIIGIIGLIVALVLAEWANYLKVSDKQLSSLGMSPKMIRLVLLLIGVILAGVSTASVGVISFIGIIIPQVGRQLLGHDYQKLVTFSVLAGSWFLLLIDTIGRTIAAPNEIAAGVLLAIVGGPAMIGILLSLNRKGKRHA